MFQIDLLIPLADQGPFTVIIHKLTDVITQAHQGDKIAQTMIANLQVGLGLVFSIIKKHLYSTSPADRGALQTMMKYKYSVQKK